MAFIAKAASMNIENNHVQSALMLAGGEGHWEIFNTLIAAGADVNAKSTALMIVEKRGLGSFGDPASSRH